MGLAVVPMVNDTVAVTPVAAATLLDSTMEGLMSAPAAIAGNTTFVAMLIAVLTASNVEIVTPELVAAPAAAFLSPANWQTT